MSKSCMSNPQAGMDDFLMVGIFYRGGPMDRFTFDCSKNVVEYVFALIMSSSKD